MNYQEKISLGFIALSGIYFYINLEGKISFIPLIIGILFATTYYFSIEKVKISLLDAQRKYEDKQKIKKEKPYMRVKESDLEKMNIIQYLGILLTIFGIIAIVIIYFINLSL
ncbi:MAG: hypothetical protein VX028_01980 [Nanoarchaeota archaeon]|nr:hypothetical protein [Nanoarchaeota archaeon]MEC8340006.1 hypothetical protein [Nanoarchaeota archaeon]